MSNPPLPPTTSADMATRIDELKHQVEENIRDQHLVSRVVLRRFTNSNGKLLPVNVRHPNAKSRPKGPRGVGKIPNFVPVASKSAEGLWKTVEDNLPRAFALCDKGELHQDPAALDLIRSMIALHYIRSLHFSVVHKSAYEIVRGRVARVAMADPRFEREFVRRHGLYPVGPESAEPLLDELFAEQDKNFVSGLLFRESVERNFIRAKGWLSNHAIELIYPAVGEFLIGDTPALTISKDDRLGPAAGVALGDAVQIIMPIGRRCLVAVGPASKVGTVSRRVVQQLNEYQIRAASNYVYIHPDSNLEGFVRRIRFGSGAGRYRD